jgi:hypothetical protein
MAKAKNASGWSFAAAFREHWFAAMSGGASVPFAVLAAYLDNASAKTLFVLAAATCSGFAAYRVWKPEREKVIELEERLAPKLSLSFEQRPPWISRIEDSNIPTPENSQNTAPSIWFSVRVVNHRPGVTVKGCRAALTAIEVLRDGRWAPTRFSSSLPLRWAESLDGHQRIDLPHEEIRLANVLSVDPTWNRIQVKWDQNWKVNERIFDEPGQYRLTIVASSVEGVSASIQLIVTWTGRWDDTTVRREE